MTTPQPPHRPAKQGGNRSSGGPAGVCPTEPGRQGLSVPPDTAAPPRERTRGGLTPDGRFRSGRLAGLTMWGAVWVLSWPVLVESFLNSLVGLTDTTLAAGLPDGTAATDAVGAASYVMWFIGLTIMALAIGATALVSRSVGKGRTAVASAVVGQTITFGVLSGVIVGVFVALTSHPVAMLLNLSAEALDAFDTYMLIIAAGVPFASVLFGLIACARGAGDSVRPLQAMVVRNIVNIAVSWLLSGAAIAGHVSPLGLGWGVAGIALGTVAGDAVGACMVLRMASSGVWGIRLRARRLRPHWHTARRLFRLGMPNFVETFGMWVGNFLVIVMVGWIAVQHATEGLLGAHIIAIRIESFSFLPGFAMGTAAATLAGQYLGAGDPARARASMLRCTGIAAAVMGVVGLALALFPRWVTGLLTDEPVHLAQTPTLLLIAGVVQVPFAIGIVLRSAMRGAGDVRVVAILTWVTTYALRLPMAYLLSGVDLPLPESLGGGVIENPFPYDWGLAGLWIGLCGELVLRGVLFCARFLQGGWARQRV